MKQVHLAVSFPGVNTTTVWSDPAAGSQIEFSSFEHLARTAERAKFDFFFLAEGLRLREHAGRIHDLDVMGRPDTLTVLAALSAVTERIGLTGTISTTFNEPYEVARQFASLDHLSGGRAGWNVVTTWNAFTGENFRRGGYLPQEERYARARSFLAAATKLFDAEPPAGAFAHHDEYFDIAGHFTVPRSPQGRPVIIQAGDSNEGREFAASAADAIFTVHAGREAGQAFYADVKGRLARYGRRPEDLVVLASATFALADTDAEAHEYADHVRRQQISGQTAMLLAEQVWNRDLSAYDPDGPLPEIDPLVGTDAISKGRATAHFYRDPLATVAQWRELAAAKKLSIRDVIIEVTGRQTFIGSPATVAATIDDLVRSDATDGYIFAPHLTPGGLDEFADKVVPLLQERGVFRADYTGPTLRDHLGIGRETSTSG
jgi:FMN-dependent oxidoreductase (nitrilotriacetate monooxygenase family)